jgi:hypothetical protein
MTDVEKTVMYVAAYLAILILGFIKVVANSRK